GASASAPRLHRGYAGAASRAATHHSCARIATGGGVDAVAGAATAIAVVGAGRPRAMGCTRDWAADTQAPGLIARLALPRAGRVAAVTVDAAAASAVRGAGARFAQAPCGNADPRGAELTQPAVAIRYAVALANRTSAHAAGA